jgi:hypothetical protein
VKMASSAVIWKWLVAFFPLFDLKLLSPLPIVLALC